MIFVSIPVVNLSDKISKPLLVNLDALSSLYQLITREFSFLNYSLN